MNTLHNNPEQGSNDSYCFNHDENAHFHTDNVMQQCNNTTINHEDDIVLGKKFNENHESQDMKQNYFNGYNIYQSAANNNFDGQDWEREGSDDDLNKEDDDDDFLQGSSNRQLSIDRNI